jgi:hypothetical protein
MIVRLVLAAPLVRWSAQRQQPWRPPARRLIRDVGSCESPSGRSVDSCLDRPTAQSSQGWRRWQANNRAVTSVERWSVDPSSEVPRARTIRRDALDRCIRNYCPREGPRRVSRRDTRRGVRGGDRLRIRGGMTADQRPTPRRRLCAADVGPIVGDIRRKRCDTTRTTLVKNGATV